MEQNLIIEKQIMNRIRGENLYWDEEDQLQAISDDDISAYYFYDNAGERSWKVTGTKQTYTHSGITTIYSNFNQFTLYLFPEVTVTAQGYTKHIFAGTERICSKIGKGKAKGLDLYSTTMPSANEITTKRANQRSLIDKVFPSICYKNFSGIKLCISGQNIMSCNILKNKLDSLTINSTVVENSRYFYIFDNINSASWVCDKDGNPLQHLRYYPYGQVLLNQKVTGSTYDSEFKYSGKLFDSESNYSYFGYRYYDANSGIWLSVDPFSDYYPTRTPFAYCKNDPLNYIDPDGRFITKSGAERFRTKNGLEGNIRYAKDKRRWYIDTKDQGTIGRGGVTVLGGRIFGKKDMPSSGKSGGSSGSSGRGGVYEHATWGRGEGTPSGNPTTAWDITFLSNLFGRYNKIEFSNIKNPLLRIASDVGTVASKVEGGINIGNNLQEKFGENFEDSIKEEEQKYVKNHQCPNCHRELNQEINNPSYRCPTCRDSFYK